MNECSFPDTWLAPGNYITNEDFSPTYKSINRLAKCFRHFLPNSEFCFQTFIKIKNNYKIVLNQEIYDIHIYGDLKIPIHQQLAKDLIRTIRRHRKDQNIFYQQDINSNDDFIMQSFAHILIFVNENGIAYKQGFGDLLIPFYHFTYYAFRTISSDTPDMLLIESITANLFYHFLNDYHLQYFQKEIMDQRMNTLQNIICDSEMFKIFSKCKIRVSDFAIRWFLLIFLQDFPLSKVFLIWDFLLETPNLQSFYSLLMDLCITIISIREEDCKKQKNSVTILQFLQDISDIDVNLIFAKVGRKNAKK